MRWATRMVVGFARPSGPAPGHTPFGAPASLAFRPAFTFAVRGFDVRAMSRGGS